MKRALISVVLLAALGGTPARAGQLSRAAKDVQSLDVTKRVKNKFKQLDAFHAANAERRAKGRPSYGPPGHLALVGKKGSGKTAVAKAYAHMLKQRGAIK